MHTMRRKKSNENTPPSGIIPCMSRGYFAFPAGRVLLKDNLDLQPGDVSATGVDEKKERVWDERLQQEEEERRRRLRIEGEIASEGEWEWVRSGGVLRDIQGRRDRARTERIRQEIRLQMEEQLVMQRWESYENRWRALLVLDGPVTFIDMPWPLESAPTDVDQLTPGAISKFLLAPLHVRGNTVTQRERIRASMLRWHPDKLASVLRRVVENDAELVREGVGAVFRCLNTLQQEK